MSGAIQPALLNINHGQGTILDIVGNIRMSKKFCSRGAHSNQHIKPKRIQDKKAPVTGREETFTGREKQEGRSARDICKSLDGPDSR